MQLNYVYLFQLKYRAISNIYGGITIGQVNKHWFIINVDDLVFKIRSRTCPCRQSSFVKPVSLHLGLPIK